jgi:hypothetical protein
MCYVFPSGLIYGWNKHEILYRVESTVDSKELKRWNWVCWPGGHVASTAVFFV